jgi:hypothetical protein
MKSRARHRSTSGVREPRQINTGNRGQSDEVRDTRVPDRGALTGGDPYQGRTGNIHPANVSQARGTDPPGMANNENRSGRQVAWRVAGLVLAIVAVNLLLRVAPLPDVGFSSIDLPDLPGWFRDAIRAKNWALGAVAVLVAVGAVINAVVKERRRDETDAGDQAH